MERIREAWRLFFPRSWTPLVSYLQSRHPRANFPILYTLRLFQNGTLYACPCACSARPLRSLSGHMSEFTSNDNGFSTIVSSSTSTKEAEYINFVRYMLLFLGERIIAAFLDKTRWFGPNLAQGVSSDILLLHDSHCPQAWRYSRMGSIQSGGASGALRKYICLALHFGKPLTPFSVVQRHNCDICASHALHQSSNSAIISARLLTTGPGSVWKGDSPLHSHTLPILYRYILRQDILVRPKGPNMEQVRSWDVSW